MNDTQLGFLDWDTYQYFHIPFHQDHTVGIGHGNATVSLSLNVVMDKLVLD